MNSTVPATQMAIKARAKCRLCTCALTEAEGDDFDKGVCTSCSTRPEAKRLCAPAPVVLAVHSQLVVQPARSFTPAEKSLISKMHTIVPAQQLLDLLNERLSFDLGPDAGKYTMEMLRAQIGEALPKPELNDWASLRKLLVQAKRNGVLGQINEQVINDFAVVFSLNPKQVLILKDILLKSQEVDA